MFLWPFFLVQVSPLHTHRPSVLAIPAIFGSLVVRSSAVACRILHQRAIGIVRPCSPYVAAYVQVRRTKQALPLGTCRYVDEPTGRYLAGPGGLRDNRRRAKKSRTAEELLLQERRNKRRAKQKDDGVWVSLHLTAACGVVSSS